MKTFIKCTGSAAVEAKRGRAGHGEGVDTARACRRTSTSWHGVTCRLDQVAELLPLGLHQPPTHTATILIFHRLT
ncbi:hypothetical protein DEV91_12510 [Phyllobacterium brassicacearum]|nr:hypothetical protein DEV91_12510 [Phyllobacterium brassicacearum]